MQKGFPVASTTSSWLLALLLLLTINKTSSQEVPSYLAKIHQLRDTVNQKSSMVDTDLRPAKKNKPKKYKCILIEDEEEQQVPAQTLANRMETLKAPSFVKELNVKASHTQNHEVQEYGEQQQHNNEAPAYFYTTTTLGTTTTRDVWGQEIGLSYTLQPEQMENAQPVEPPSTTSAPRPLSTSLSKPLRQIMLPRAHGIPLRKGSVHSVAIAPAPPVNEVVNDAPRPATPTPAIAPSPVPQVDTNIPKDAQNRPLVLAPENCKMIEHYAGLYGVKDVKSWVHQNCSFAKMYLPTASCAEIDILVASCSIAQ